ncbi:GTPase Era [Hahella sp. SMD15-11]|uniref:GTPase Era n=1 Tax=Thermohahella caldifontis TaxID=3142973 RepID=A0AB39V092_9GAMM
MTESTRCGYVAIVGRPNVGKSTLLNRILGQKLSITCRKAQTTRHQILGIKTEGASQFIYVDTPGMHLVERKALNKVMNRAAVTALRDADVIVMVVERNVWNEEDQWVAEQVAQVRKPRILVINKVDLVKDKRSLLPFIERVTGILPCDEVVPLSAEKGDNVEVLEQTVARLLPESIHFFPEDQLTDRSERFVVAELIREKLMRLLGDEVPYDLTVEIEQFRNEGKRILIHALILVAKESQKRIVIGEQGSKIKRVGTEARQDIERFLGQHVRLELWVKVKSGWADNERALRSLGYDS